MENILINPCPYCRSRTCCYVLSGDLEIQDANIEVLRQENARLQDALIALRHEELPYYPKGCWCGNCLGNPNYSTHTSACIKAQEAIAELRKGKA